MVQVKIVNNIITEVISSSELQDGYEKVLNDQHPQKGDNRKQWDSNWVPLDMADLISAGLLSLPSGVIYDSTLDEIRVMTIAEMVADKETLTAGTVVYDSDLKSTRLLTLSEMVAQKINVTAETQIYDLTIPGVRIMTLAEMLNQKITLTNSTVVYDSATKTTRVLTMLEQAENSVITLVVYQAYLCGLVEATKSTKLKAGFSYTAADGKTYTVQANDEARSDIQAIITGASLGAVTFPYTFFLSSGGSFQLAESEVSAFAKAMFTFYSSVLTSLRATETAINATTSVDSATTTFTNAGYSQ